MVARIAIWEQMKPISRNRLVTEFGVSIDTAAAFMASLFSILKFSKRSLLVSTQKSIGLVESYYHRLKGFIEFLALGVRRATRTEEKPHTADLYTFFG